MTPNKSLNTTENDPNGSQVRPVTLRIGKRNGFPSYTRRVLVEWNGKRIELGYFDYAIKIMKKQLNKYGTKINRNEWQIPITIFKKFVSAVEYDLLGIDPLMGYIIRFDLMEVIE